MQILSFLMYNFVIGIEFFLKGGIFIIYYKQEGNIHMKKLINVLKSKYGVVGLMNLCALAAVIQTVNVTCGWVQHQPEVPEAAQKFKKF